MQLERSTDKATTYETTWHYRGGQLDQFREPHFRWQQSARAMKVLDMKQGRAGELRAVNNDKLYLKINNRLLLYKVVIYWLVFRYYESLLSKLNLT
jgi:hypothetical protein